MSEKLKQTSSLTGTKQPKNRLSNFEGSQIIILGSLHGCVKGWDQNITEIRSQMRLPCISISHTAKHHEILRAKVQDHC